MNNVYLDSWNSGHYQAHLEGTGWRRKIRVRWYGELCAEQAAAVLELKIRSGQVGTKRRFDLGTFDASGGVDFERIRECLVGAELPADLKCEIDSMKPALLNRYRREYFVSLDGRLRLTVDGDQSFYEVGGGKNPDLVRWRCDGDEIIELKYAMPDEDAALQAGQYFPFRLTRHSKYARGISLIHSEPPQRYVL